MISTSRFPPPGPLRRCVPRTRRYYQDAVTPRCPSRFASLPSRSRYHGSTRPGFRSPRRRVRSMRRAWSLLTRRLRPGIMHVETSGPPKFSWSLICPFAHVHATPAGRVSLTVVKHPCCPRSFNDEGSDDSTIEAQLHGFRTRCLRLAVQVTHTPRKTHSRLLVRLCRTGLSPAKAPLKGFRLNFS